MSGERDVRVWMRVFMLLCLRDEALTSAAVTRAIAVTPVNDPPTLALDSTAVTWSEKGAAVALASSSTIGDVDGTVVSKATVAVTGNYEATDVLAYSGTVPAGFTAVYTAPNMTIAGSGTFVQYQGFLSAVYFGSTSLNPSPSTRTATLVVYDGPGLASAAATKNFTGTLRCVSLVAAVCVCDYVSM